SSFVEYIDKNLSPELAKYAIYVKPLDTLDFQISDEKYKNLESFLKEKLGNSFTLREVQLMIERIIYDDDTAYVTGTNMRRDPDKRNQWINEKYFDQIKRKISLQKLPKGLMSKLNSFAAKNTSNLDRNAAIGEAFVKSACTINSASIVPVTGNYNKYNKASLPSKNAMLSNANHAKSINIKGRTAPTYSCVEIITTYAESCGFALGVECFTNQAVYWPGGWISLWSSYEQCSNSLGGSNCWMSNPNDRVTGYCIIVDNKGRPPVKQQTKRTFPQVGL
ncbi:MAG: hypothetical protein JST84_28880, partial [Acidobacteria bacterium]|nr:hypothetical protein [Acidobacteriota bacterium]